jgi:hypothetical protein
MKHQVPNTKSKTLTKVPTTEMRGLGHLGIGYCNYVENTSSPLVGED